MSKGTWSLIASVFRGHEREYNLKPSIERAVEQTGKMQWSALELMVLNEFQCKARLHLDPADLPSIEQKLSWLAVMQHYGVPTRLLDFTFSPFVAMYFALRNRAARPGSAPVEAPVEVWAIDAAALMVQADVVSSEADKQEESITRGGTPAPGQHVSFRPADMLSDRNMLEEKNERLARMLARALSPSGIRREHFNQTGFVALAEPPLQNRRLSSQQGAFLFSGAEDLSFEDSLFKMMSAVTQPWCKRFQIATKALLEVERRLFQLNIHDLSLFPDTEGLAGFIRQKIRLQWGLTSVSQVFPSTPSAC
jgi:FRG domain